MKVKSIKQITSDKFIIVNSNFKITSADSGRNKCGFHNIPNGDCKGFYTSRFKGGALLMPDLSAAEVKTVAGAAHEDSMLEAFKKGLDIHRYNASVAFDKPIEEVTKNERSIAKGITFGILYGSTVRNLALSYFKGDVAEAQALLDKFYAGFPKLKTFIDEKHEQARIYHAIPTITNRVIHVPDKKVKGRIDEGSRDRRSQNLPIQGGSEDIAGWIAYNLCMYYYDHNMKSKLEMMIHDSFETDVFPTELFDIIKFSDELLNHKTAEYWKVPMSSDVVIGPSIGQECELKTLDLRDALKDEEIKDKIISNGIINKLVDVDKWHYIKLEGNVEDINELVYGTHENPNGWTSAYKEVIELDKEEHKEKDEPDYISWSRMTQSSHAPLQSNFGKNIYKGEREFLILNELRDDYWD